MRVLSNLDLAKNQLLNFRMQLLGSAPSAPVEGLAYFDSTVHAPFFYDGTSWINAFAVGGAVAFADLTGKPTTLAGYGITDGFSGSYTDLTNKPTPFSGIYGDLTGLPDLTLLAPKASPTFTGTVTIPTPSGGDNSTKAASTAFVKTAIDGLINSAPGTLDTLGEIATALASNDSAIGAITTAISLKADINSAALTGIPTAPTAAPATNSTQLATTAYVDAAAAAVVPGLRYSTTIGDGTATSYVVTHNLNSRDIVIGISEAATPWNVVYADIAKTSVNTVTISGFSVAPTSASLRVTVIG